MTEEKPSSQSVDVAGSHNLIVQFIGDGNKITVGEPHLCLTRYETRRLAADAGQGEEDTLLLSAYGASIPMLGREETLKSLWSWMEDGRPISVKALIGSAGRGKTRLALELADAAAGKGWRAGFVTAHELARFQGQQNLAAWGWNAPTLVIVDYAARDVDRIRDWLAELSDHRNLTDAEAARGKPFRLLLLERQAGPTGGWWADLFGRADGEGRAVRRLLDGEGPVELPEIATPERRREILAATLARAGSDLVPPQAGLNPDFDRKLAELTWGGEPLFLMMAALTAARANFEHVLALARDDLAFKIAERELTRIEGIAGARGLPAPFARHMAAAATLCQVLGRASAHAVIDGEKRALGREGAGDAATVFETLRRALPDPAAEAVSPILPDVVGEAAMLRVWDGHRGRDGAAAALRLVAVSRAAVVAGVVRTCQDFAIHGHEAPLLWLDALGDQATPELPTLLELLDAIPLETLSMRETDLRLNEVANTALLARVATDDSEINRSMLAISYNNLSVRLGSLGRREEALAAVAEAVAIRRDLATARPDAFRPDLAMSLNNLSARLSSLGRREEALAAVAEAVALYRDLATAHPDAFRPDLAGALNNLSGDLSSLSRREEALAAVEEAVAIRRDLAAARPDAFRPDLAMSLNNMSNRLSSLGRREEALAAVEEAVAIRRDLAAARPDAFRPDLAAALNNLSVHLTGLARPEEAQSATLESVVIYRELAAEYPDAFRPDLAMSLLNLAIDMIEARNMEEALTHAEEAGAIYRDMAERHPDAFGEDLARAAKSVGAHSGRDRRWMSQGAV